MIDVQSHLSATLRGRLLRGLQGGTLAAGDRLPSAREISAEFGVDHRLGLAAYRQLADEGLVDVRERAGVYVASTGLLPVAAPPVRWLVDVFTDALSRELPPRSLADWLAHSLDTVRLRAVVVAASDEQAAELTRELADDFGLEAVECIIDMAGKTLDPFASAARADVVIAARACADTAATLARRLGRPFIAIDLRPDLASGEWALMLRQPIWVVVATPAFAALLRSVLAPVEGIENLHVLVHGRDDLTAIPANAPTYLTARVRRALGDTPIGGRPLPPPRVIAVESARAILTHVVHANLRAFNAIHGVDDQLRERPPERGAE